MVMPSAMNTPDTPKESTTVTAPVATAPVSLTSTPSTSPLRISLTTELASAALGAFIAGMGTFTAALTVVTASDVKALETGAIGAGFAALTYFGNSLKNWFQQRNNVV